MEYISTNLENKTVWLNSNVTAMEARVPHKHVTVTDIPHEAGHEEAKNKSDLNPVLKCDRLWTKRQKSVRQEKAERFGNKYPEMTCWIRVTASTCCRSPVKALAKKVGMTMISAL